MKMKANLLTAFLFVAGLFCTTVLYANENFSYVPKEKDSLRFARFSMLIPEFNERQLKVVDDASIYEVKHFNLKVARQLELIKSRYMQLSEADEDYYALIYKPSIYYSVQKAKSHYKKQIKKNPESKEELCDEFSKLLGKAVTVGNYNSEEFEKCLKAAKNSNEIIFLFSRIDEFTTKK